MASRPSRRRKFSTCWPKFADYGFNKSHAAAYALIAYQTAWFKANYPVEFIAASMTLDKPNTDKLSEFANEAKRLGITVEPPSITRSGSDFEVHPGEGEKLAIRYALSAVKGVGDGQAQGLVAARGDKPFRDLADFAGRLNPRDANKRVLESLCAAGAFDGLDRERAKVFGGIETLDGAGAAPHPGAARRPERALRLRHGGDAGAGENSGLAVDRAAAPRVRRRRLLPLRPPARRLYRRARAHAGDALDGHSAAPSKAAPRPAVSPRPSLDKAERRTRSGSKMGIVNLSDQSGQYEAILFEEGLNQFRDLLVKGASVLVGIQAQLEGEDVRARIVSVEPLDQAAQRVQKGLRIFIRGEQPLGSIAQAAIGERRGRGLYLRDERRAGNRDPAARPLPGVVPDRRRAEGDPGDRRGGAYLGALACLFERSEATQKSAYVYVDVAALDRFTALAKTAKRRSYSITARAMAVWMKSCSGMPESAAFVRASSTSKSTLTAVLLDFSVNCTGTMLDRSYSARSTFETKVSASASLCRVGSLFFISGDS